MVHGWCVDGTDEDVWVYLEFEFVGLPNETLNEIARGSPWLPWYFRQACYPSSKAFDRSPSLSINFFYSLPLQPRRHLLSSNCNLHLFFTNSIHTYHKTDHRPLADQEPYRVSKNSYQIPLGSQHEEMFSDSSSV
jgi:hypothetical protein